VQVLKGPTENHRRTGIAAIKTNRTINPCLGDSDLCINNSWHWKKSPYYLAQDSPVFESVDLVGLRKA